MKTKLKRGAPKTGETPKRVFRMKDDDWQEVVRAAKLEGRNTSEHIRIAVQVETERVLAKHNHE